MCLHHRHSAAPACGLVLGAVAVREHTRWTSHSLIIIDDNSNRNERKWLLGAPHHCNPTNMRQRVLITTASPTSPC
ncbi:hypothetical protein DL89DRAFT_268761 [Linderina pennispora]|uniref:Uncharacterized protein n=1 Tax=Linderina pennispora TaxID=61395 RepID=A0A1Y1W4A4_9FUNG|nr:uncharacterized protein DL89DRAFT_268761 [Linderina pennispora]ORX68248.1 hypothetical protein DL89DRAFT_268761 [Linderina pennispora]